MHYKFDGLYFVHESTDMSMNYKIFPLISNLFDSIISKDVTFFSDQDFCNTSE